MEISEIESARRHLSLGRVLNHHDCKMYLPRFRQSFQTHYCKTDLIGVRGKSLPKTHNTPRTHVQV